MYKPRIVYDSGLNERAYTASDYDAQRKTESVEKGGKSGLLMKLEWPEEGIFDDGKQSNTLTGAAHPGCCKQ